LVPLHAAFTVGTGGGDAVTCLVAVVAGAKGGEAAAGRLYDMIRGKTKR
jgi:hypothetical protein